MNKGQNVAYIRVSTIAQNPDRQLDGLEFDRVFTDNASGKDVNRPQLQELIKYVREGDTVFVHSIDRLARNVSDLRELVKEFTNRGVAVKFETEGLVFTSEEKPEALMMLSVLGSYAEFERATIRERQREGIALAKKRGAYKGRKQSLNSKQIDQLRARVYAGGVKTKLAKEFKISRETLYRYLREEKG